MKMHGCGAMVVWALLTVTVTAGVSQQKGWQVEIGTRMAYDNLHDESRGAGDYYLGSIDELKLDRNYIPLPFLYVRPSPYWALGVGYDYLRADTWSRPDDQGEIGHTDGAIQISGLAFSLQGRFPNASPFTPYAEVGAILYNARFDHAPEWRDAGGNVGSHLMRVRDNRGYRLGVGCDVSVCEHWDVVLFVERTFIDIDTMYYLYESIKATAVFPLDHTSAGVGVKYRF